METKLPVLKGFKRNDSEYISVWCPYCNTWHNHGEGEGSRTPHCISVGNNWGGEYSIKLFTKNELKRFRKQILGELI